MPFGVVGRCRSRSADTGWYALLFRDVTSAVKILDDYSPPLSGTCARSDIQYHVKVHLRDDVVGAQACAFTAGDCSPTSFQSGARTVCAAGPTNPNDNLGVCPGNDAAPESHAPFAMVHEIGHIANLRWLCLTSGDEISGSFCPDPATQGNYGHGWETATTERCATAEGWANFFRIAAMWPRTSVTALYATTNGSTTNPARQVELISPLGAPDTNWSAANRNCECNDAGESGGGLYPQMCDGAPAVAFWDGYDTNPDDGDGGGLDNDSSPATDSMLFMLQGAALNGGWWNFRDGTANYENMEDDGNVGADGLVGPVLSDCGTGANPNMSPIDCARNTNDYDVNHTGLSLVSERDQACIGEVEPGG